MSDEVKDKVFEEFNSLSVIFQAPSSTFVEKRAFFSDLEEEIKEGPSRREAGPGSVNHGAAATADLLGDELYDSTASLLGGDLGGGGVAEEASCGGGGGGGGGGGAEADLMLLWPSLTCYDLL